MRISVGLLALLTSSAAMAGERSLPIAPGTYSNEEQVYFDKEAKRAAPPSVFIQIMEGKISTIDAFGKPVSGNVRMAQLSPGLAGRINLRLPDGRNTELRKARPVSCWIAIRKDKPKADGSEDWFYQSGVMLHDQGGRAEVGGDDTGAQRVIIRLRNVTWDVGSTNKPVVTLYVHKPENPDHAEAYAWAAPDSARVGINLRWVQAGCSIDPPTTGTKALRR